MSSLPPLRERVEPSVARKSANLQIISIMELLSKSQLLADSMLFDTKNKQVFKFEILIEELGKVQVSNNRGRISYALKHKTKGLIAFSLSDLSEKLKELSQVFKTYETEVQGWSAVYEEQRDERTELIAGNQKLKERMKDLNYDLKNSQTALKLIEDEKFSLEIYNEDLLNESKLKKFSRVPKSLYFSIGVLTITSSLSIYMLSLILMKTSINFERLVSLL